MDLVGRKLTMEDGALAERFFAMVRADLAQAKATVPTIANATGEALERLETASKALLASRADLAAAGSAATDYLRLFALVSFGWMWTRMAAATQDKDSVLARRKQAVAQFFADKMLPQTIGLAASIASGSRSIMALDADLF